MVNFQDFKTKFKWFLKTFRKILHIKNTDNQSMKAPHQSDFILPYLYDKSKQKIQVNVAEENSAE